MNATLCSACGGWLSTESLPMMISMGVGFLVAALLCGAAALGWRRQAPPCLYQLPAVLLTALQWACSGTSVTHQVWLCGCRRPGWPTILWSLVAPALSGRRQLWLSCDATACAAGY